MKLNRNDYTVEEATGGSFYAYFMNNVLCMPTYVFIP